MMPCTIVIVPSVTMNGSLSKYTTKNTLTRPTMTAAPIPARQARSTFVPCCTLSTARTIAERPSEEPSERSTKSPMIVGSITAITRMNSTAWEPRMLERLPIERKVDGMSAPNATIIATNTMTIAKRWRSRRRTTEGLSCSGPLLMAAGFDGSCRSRRGAHLTSLICRSAAAVIASSLSSSPVSVLTVRPSDRTMTRSQTSASSPKSVVTHSTDVWPRAAADFTNR